MRTSNHPTLRPPVSSFKPVQFRDLKDKSHVTIYIGSGAWKAAEQYKASTVTDEIAVGTGADTIAFIDGAADQPLVLTTKQLEWDRPPTLASKQTRWIGVEQHGDMSPEDQCRVIELINAQSAPDAQVTLDGEPWRMVEIMREVDQMNPQEDPADFVDRYVYATATSLYINKATKEAMPGTSFNVKHSRDTPSNGDKKVSATTYVNGSIEIVSDTMYHPQAAKNGDIFEHNRIRYLNLYKPVDLSRVKVGTTDAVKIVKGHIAHLLEDPKEQEILINYLAHNAQYPGIKIPWAIVLQGVEGDGKSFFMEMMQSVMGFENVKSISGSTVMTNFTGWAVGQCMVFIEELKISGHGKYEALNNLKQFITNPTIEVIRKGKDGFNAINTSNYIALTNYQDAIPIGDNDRRYCVMFSRWQSKSDLAGFLSENPDYYERLYNNTAENAGEILDWLLTHEIPEWFMKTKRAPETAAKQAMIQAAKSPTLVAVEDALDEFMPWIFEGDELNVTKLQEEVKRKQALAHNSPIYDDFPKTKALSSILTEMGWQPSGRRRPKGSAGNKNSFYRKR